MKYSKAIWILFFCSFLAACSPEKVDTPKKKINPVPEGDLIPRTMQEKAKYYLISVEPDGSYLRTVHSRVSSMSHGYSVTRIDCSAKRYQDLGYGEDDQSNIKMYKKVNWSDTISGSSKSDLVNFTCQK